MEVDMRRRTILLAACAGALVASLIIGPAATAKPDAASAGTVVIGADQEPVTLNFYLTEGNSYTTSLAVSPMLAAGMVYNQNAKLVPFLFDGEPKVLKSNPLTVTFKYKASAKWSDGRPLTGTDFLATYKTIMNPNWDITSREGWEDIASVKAKGKAVTVAWKKGRAYAAWDALVGNTSPMPAHKVAGQNFNDLWRNGLDVASGPFKFVSWQKGTQLVMTKNTAYNAGPKAKVDRVIFRYIPSTPSIFQALQSGEIDETEPQAQLQIVDIRKNSNFKVQSGPGYFWEHMDIQFGPQGHPALKKKYVRQAIITGINRNQIKAGAVRRAWPGREREGPARAAEPHLQALRAVLQAELGEVELQPEEGHHPAEEERLHRRPQLAVGEQQRHLELPGRREAVVPLHDHERQPAPRVDVRDRAEAAQERRYRADPAVRPVRDRLRADPPVR